MNEKWKSHFVCRHKWLREWIEKCNCHMEPRFLRMQNRVYLWVYWTKSILNQMQHFYSFTSANRIFKCANVPFLFVFESNDGVLLSLNVFFFLGSLCNSVSVCWKLSRMMKFIVSLRLWNCRKTADYCLYNFAMFLLFILLWFSVCMEKIDAQ